jgi:hypothetical protein
MKRQPMWRRYLRFWGSNRQADVETELGFHLDEQTERYIREGMSRDAARHAAERRFGDVERARRECLTLDERHERSRARLRSLGDFLHDARVGLRVIGRQPAFALAVVLTLVLGIGANVTLFSVVRAVMLRPLPYEDPGRLVALWETDLPASLSRATVRPSRFSAPR